MVVVAVAGVAVVAAVLHRVERFVILESEHALLGRDSVPPIARDLKCVTLGAQFPLNGLLAAVPVARLPQYVRPSTPVGRQMPSALLRFWGLTSMDNSLAGLAEG